MIPAVQRDLTQSRQRDELTPPLCGDRVEVAVHELGYGGVGVGRLETGLVVLVPRTLPGERVEAEVVRRKPKLAHARALRIVQASPRRIEAPCPHFETCGGCHLQHLGYADQLAAKHDVLVRNLERAVGTSLRETIEPVVPSPAAFGYRNRSFYHVQDGRLGFVDPLSQTVVATDTCPVAEPVAQPLVDTVRAWLRTEARDLAPAVLDVLVRTGRGSALCVLVLAEEDLPAADLRRWREGERTPRLEPLDRLAEALAPAGVWVSAKPRASMDAFGEDVVHVAGPERIVERVGPFVLELSPASFAQANPAVAAALYARATQLLAPAHGDAVLDLFCGSGALSFHLARAARAVYGVELSWRALADARVSAARNGITNVDWRAGKCERIALKLARGGARFPCAAVNPPRTGLHDDLPELLARLDVRRLAYISCSPPTLARDLARLRTAGFALRRIVPFDMFAQTYHLEVLTLLER